MYDIKYNENYQYYEGFEGEQEIIITIHYSIYHIWDGYFEDIFGGPVNTKNGWIGFTRDYNEFINAFDENIKEYTINKEEYLEDLMLYKGRKFRFDETIDVLDCLIELLVTANNNNQCVITLV